MVNRNGVLKALSRAIQMEIVGREFYLKASGLSGNKLGRKLLETLAYEEDDHRRRFVEIYDTLRKKKPWSDNFALPKKGKRVTLRSLLGDFGKVPKSGQGEIDAVKFAMNFEDKTHDFYTRRADVAESKNEKEFYRAIASEESRHKLALLDYYEYLKDPNSWFVEKEHPSLDGV